MTLLEFRPFAKNSLHGFATVALANGLTIADCPVHVSANGRVWTALPAKPMLNRDGRQITLGGKKQYDAVLKWRDRALADCFSETFVALVREHHPGALEENQQ